MYISYGQIMIYDHNTPYAGLHWTEPHYKQGFARTQEQASFRTLHEYGHVDLAVHTSDCPKIEDWQTRIIDVPIQIGSGVAVISGPEEDEGRTVSLRPGHYRVCVAQGTRDGRDSIVVCFHSHGSPNLQSAILRADDELSPGECLLEICELSQDTIPPE